MPRILSKYFGGTDHDGCLTTPKIKRSVSTTLKKKVEAEQVWRCNCCRKIVDHTYAIDHIRPLELGGTNDRHNLQMLCVHCHALKTADETEWRVDGAMY